MATKKQQVVDVNKKTGHKNLNFDGDMADIFIWK